MEPIKLEQVAIYAPDPYAKQQQLREALGLTEWVEDTVRAVGEVFGVEQENLATLLFNHQLGYELELICYHNPFKPNNWHSAAGRDMATTFLSHKGYHVTDVAAAKQHYRDCGFAIAQEVYTIEHSNAYLRKIGRRYHYVVYDTRQLLGFDLKLIERIEGGGAKQMHLL